MMLCPKCGGEAKRVVQAKTQSDPDGWSMMVRKRYCVNGHTFATYECYEYADVEVVFRCRKLLGLVLSGLEEIDQVAQAESSNPEVKTGV